MMMSSQQSQDGGDGGDNGGDGGDGNVATPTCPYVFDPQHITFPPETAHACRLTGPDVIIWVVPGPKPFGTSTLG